MYSSLQLELAQALHLQSTFSDIIIASAQPISPQMVHMTKHEHTHILTHKCVACITMISADMCKGRCDHCDSN